MRVCLGGTFDPLHAGHLALLQAAAEAGTSVFVGLTSGDLSKRERTLASFDDRRSRVITYWKEQGFNAELQVGELKDRMGPAASGDYDAIVVSPETREGADAINAHRATLGLPSLHVIIVPHLRSQEGRILSATRVAAGDVNPQGARRTPVRVAVGTRNDAKLAGVEAALSNCWPELSFEVQGFETDTGVPEQPLDGQTAEGARNRAKEALSAWGGADFAIGVEAGLIQVPGMDHRLDIQCVAVLDGDGWLTEGIGPGFSYPRSILDDAEAGTTISDILGPLTGDERIGSTTGAIGFLTEGRVSRAELTQWAVEMALLPRGKPSVAFLE